MFFLRCVFATALLLATTPAAHAQDSGSDTGSGSGSGSDTGSGSGSDTDSGSDSGSGTDSGTGTDSDSVAKPGVLPTLAAVVPGFLLHGSGHFVAGDKETALKLLKLQALGLSLSIASALFLQLSGGSRYANELTIPMLVSGSGLLVQTFVADIFGSAGGSNSNHYEAPRKLSVTLGYAYIHDPQFSYRHFARSSARFEHGAWRVEPLLWTALDDDNQRARLPLSYKVWSTDQGEYLRATTALTHHNFGSEFFSTYVGELSIGGRFEMQRIGDSLRGSFATVSVGGGVQFTDFKIPGVSTDYAALLLGHYGYGFYLPKSGELEMYYEHRRDTFTAGTSPSSRNGSGFMGHFGLRLRQPISDRFAIAAQAEIGSAYLITSGLEVQWGQP